MRVKDPSSLRGENQYLIAAQNGVPVTLKSLVMRESELIGTWIHNYKGLSSATVTTFTFFQDGTYSKSVETTMVIATSWDSVEDTVCDTDEGKWSILKSGSLALRSNKSGRSVMGIRIMVGGIVIDSQEFTRSITPHNGAH